VERARTEASAANRFCRRGRGRARRMGAWLWARPAAQRRKGAVGIGLAAQAPRRGTGDCRADL